MRTKNQIEAALERAANQIKEAECLVSKRREEVTRLRNLLSKADLKENGITIKIAKVEDDGGDWRSHTWTVTTSEGFVYGAGRKMRAGGSYKISRGFYAGIKDHHHKTQQAKAQGLENCPACTAEGKITHLWVMSDDLECPTKHGRIANWNEEKQCWEACKQ